MCYKQCNLCNIMKLIIVLTLIVGIIIIIAINNNNNVENKSILTTIASQGDNTTLGFTTINFSQNEIVEGNALSHEEGSDEIIINE